MTVKVNYGGFAKQPTLEKECLSAIWSQGSSCKDCQASCYRAGWSKVRATRDNEKMVNLKRKLK